MKLPNIFPLTPFDKAIVAAVLGPIIVLATTYVNGGVVTQNDLIAALVAAVVSGLAVYLKGNAAPAPAAPPVATPPASK